MDKSVFFVFEIISLQLKIGDVSWKPEVSGVKQKMTCWGWECTQHSEPLNTNQSWSHVYATASLTHSHTQTHTRGSQLIVTIIVNHTYRSQEASGGEPEGRETEDVQPELQDQLSSGSWMLMRLRKKAQDFHMNE